ncbi:hypothetical protein [Mariprofundus ferrooxydans]|uniref:hypothetical protein n=1 Tax=Mariprofundus ferrooxydans TaxID=314344 RepID=UPI0003A41A69|nr:hypothetical protein [Mariprofundus ferrooxydans]
MASSPELYSNQTHSNGKIPLPLALFFLTLSLPIEMSFYVGDFRLTLSRLLLMVMTIPILIRLSRSPQKLGLHEYCLVGYALWLMISLAVNHDIGTAMKSGGILALEVLGSYFIVRAYVTDVRTLIASIKFIVQMAIVLLPLIVIEMVSGHHYIHEGLASLTGFYYPISYEYRLGFLRSSGPFSHPILMGVFFSALIAIVWYALVKKEMIRTYIRVGLLSFAAACSLSSAPILLVLFQFFAIAWNRIAAGYKSRWKLVVAGFVGLYSFILVYSSSSSPIMVILSRITLDPSTSWYRTLIWEFGTAEVMRHPFFGIGQNDWYRPMWMPSDTIDDFWLKVAMKYGLPALFLLALAFVILAYKVSKLMDGAPKQLHGLSQGWLVSMFSLAFVGFSVDFFGEIHLYFYSLLALGAVLLSVGPTAGNGEGRNEPF